MALNVTELENASPTGNLVYDPDVLAWVRMTQPVVQAEVVNVDGKVEVIGPLTDTELRNSDVKITLDGETVGVNNFPASQAVTGTFWQATQPVSGTFWQATQPVSASALPLPSGASSVVSDEELYVVLRQLIGAIRDPVWLDIVANALKITGPVTISSGTVTTVTTVTTVANSANIGGTPAYMLTSGIDDMAWATRTRGLLV